MNRKVGICKKKGDGTVTYQNDMCRDVCGHRIGEVCKSGCMDSIDLDRSEKSFNEGFKHIRNIEIGKRLIDVILINDGDTITSLQYDQSRVVSDQLEFIKSYNLSKAETEILRNFLIGKTNKEIAAKLFISMSTLRTHLNRIYKKIPSTLKDQILNKHFGKTIKCKSSKKI